MSELITNYIDKLKYKKEIETLIQQTGLNVEVEEVTPHIVYRFIYKDNVIDSHFPPYIKIPKRALPGRKNITVAGYGLSCVETQEDAEKMFQFLRTNVSNIGQSIGDSLASGEIVETDGVVDGVDRNKHFSLYEFESCDLGSKFVFIKKLI